MLLSKGLNFAPTNQPNSFTLFKDLNRYIRNLTLKRYFSMKSRGESDTVDIVIPDSSIPDLPSHMFDHEGDIMQILGSPSITNDELTLFTQHLATSPPIVHSRFKPQSIFYPTYAKGPYIETFYRVVYSDLLKLCNSSKKPPYYHNNLTPAEIKSLDSLMHNTEIVIKAADKGGGIVIQNREVYVAEAHRLLADTNTYVPLATDPTKNFAMELHDLVKTGVDDGVVSKPEAAFLCRPFYQVPYFYHLPKVHKDLNNPPGRPIVAAMNSITTGLSQYIDSFLQPLVHGLPSYIRDGRHLMESLSSYTWESSYIWLSLDVSSLYTSIPHQFGLMATEYFLSGDPLANPRQVAFILEATRFCLHHNYFQFEEDFYLQVKGTAMGANFAPSYANLAMGYWETHHIWKNNPFSSNIVFFGRYIDDIVIIWEGSMELIGEFVTYCNQNTYGLSFTHVADTTTLAFLDLELGFHDGTIIAKNFTKPTAGNSLLHYKSCHYPPWIRNIPRGQFCRLRHNCTLQSDYVTQSVQLKAKLLDKSYPESLIDQARDSFLELHPQEVSRDTPPDSRYDFPRMITTFHTQNKKMENVLKKHWNILSQDPHLKSILPNQPKVTYRRAPNLKSKIAPSRLRSTAPIHKSLELIPLVGMFQCKKARCKTCDFVKHGRKSFKHKGKVYPLEGFYNCSSDHVVYALTCPCGLLYIGRTIQPLRQRFGKHRRLIEGGKDLHSVPRHFLEHHNRSTEGLEVWVIEQIPRSLPDAERFKRLCSRETFWIYCLDVLSPGGMNEAIEISTIL